LGYRRLDGLEQWVYGGDLVFMGFHFFFDQARAERYGHFRRLVFVVVFI